MGKNGIAEKKTGRSTSKKKVKATSKVKRKKTNLLKLSSEMSKCIVDANDKEIIKRFKTTISSSVEDITKMSLDLILKNPKDVEINDFPESIQPYIKHYLFMMKRSKNKK